MSNISIPLGKKDDLKIVYSYPNIPGSTESLEDTILHWIGMTLERDGLKKEQASIRIEKDKYYLGLKGMSEAQNTAYEKVLPKIVNIGLDAWQEIVPKVKQYHRWDPDQTGLWRFFLTLGVGVISHRSLQFFHYPPIRLLDPLKDSMHDPVTFRVRDLLVANGIPKEETKFYETRINSTPIACDDYQGSKKSPNADPTDGGLIPIRFFKDFQKDMIKALIKPHPEVEGYTIPVITYGRNPTDAVGGMFLKPNVPVVIQIIDGLKTPVLSSNHPFRFYATAQGGDDVGHPRKVPLNCSKTVQLQKEDLTMVYWQKKMAEDPSQDPWKVIQEAKDYWNAPDKKPIVCALVKRHTSLSYWEDGEFDPEGKHFHFDLSLDEAEKFCEDCGNDPCV